MLLAKNLVFSLRNMLIVLRVINSLLKRKKSVHQFNMNKSVPNKLRSGRKSQIYIGKMDAI